MTSSKRIHDAATSLGYTIITETHINGTSIVARDEEDRVRIYASYVDRRFDFGFTVDTMGHNTHHDTVTDLIAYAG